MKLSDAREDPKIGVGLLTGAGPHLMVNMPFAQVGIRSVRGDAGYVDDGGVPASMFSIYRN